MVKRCAVVDGKATVLAEESLRKALLAPEVTLLRLASHTQLISWWFFKIKDLRNVLIAIWKPLQEWLMH